MKETERAKAKDLQADRKTDTDRNTEGQTDRQAEIHKESTTWHKSLKKKKKIAKVKTALLTLTRLHNKKPTHLPLSQTFPPLLPTPSNPPPTPPPLHTHADKVPFDLVTRCPVTRTSVPTEAERRRSQSADCLS